jgi:hypothetical protein
LGNRLPIAFSLLVISIAVVPALVFLDGRVANSVTAALAAAAFAFVGISARAADVSDAAQVTRYLKLAAAVPAIWMVLQVLPTSFPGMSHSIWITANEALNRPSWGHISVDIGRTIEALITYLANASLIVVSIFVTKERQRAERILLVLTAVTMLTTIALLIAKWGGPIATATPNELNEILSAISSQGIILSLTTGTLAVDRYESKLAVPTRPTQNIQMAFALSGTGLLVCIAGLATSATLNIGLTVAFGVLTFGSVQGIRRAGLAGWATGMFVATMIIAAAMIILWRYDSLRAISPFLQFATSASADAILTAQRILSDTGWLGTGAATYASMVSIYGSSVTSAPSSVSAFAIELGWPVTLLTIAAAMGSVVVLYRGAIIRRRDSFFPAAAAASAIISLGQAFCDTSLLHSCIYVIGDAVIGLGLAQSVSRGNSPQP